MRDEQSKFVIPVGMISFLTIFVTLIVVLLTVLMVSGVANDTQFTQKSAEGISAYYEAENRAEIKLARIHKEFKEKAMNEFKELVGEEGAYFIENKEREEIVIEYIESIDINRELVVQIGFNIENKNYRKICWKVRSVPL